MIQSSRFRVTTKWLAFAAIIFCMSLLWTYYKHAQLILSQDVSAWTEDHRADCAVVLTGGPGRVREGFDLLAQGRIRKLIISGVYHQAELRDIFPQWPYYGPISEEDVVLEKRSSTTYGNAQQTLPLVEALRCQDVLLITSRLHMQRSHRLFQAVFPTEIKITTRSIVSGSLKPTLVELFIESTKSIFYEIWAY